MAVCRIIRCWRLSIAVMLRICGTDPGTFPRGKDALPFFVQMVAALSPFFHIRRVLCDSGFYRIDFIKKLENESFPYILAVPITPVIQRELPGSPPGWS